MLFIKLGFEKEPHYLSNWNLKKVPSTHVGSILRNFALHLPNHNLVECSLCGYLWNLMSYLLNAISSNTYGDLLNAFDRFRGKVEDHFPWKHITGSPSKTREINVWPYNCCSLAVTLKGHQFLSPENNVDCFIIFLSTRIADQWRISINILWMKHRSLVVTVKNEILMLFMQSACSGSPCNLEWTGSILKDQKIGTSTPAQILVHLKQKLIRKVHGKTLGHQWMPFLLVLLLPLS